MTKIISDDISAAVDIIAEGGLVAVPTETVYGLAANGLDAKAVERIYEVKGRPAIKPLSLMVPDKSAMERYCDCVPEAALELADRFWPGPLTIVLKAKQLVPEIVRAGGDTVGLRCPDHPKTLQLLRALSLPLAAPSANPSDMPSPKNAQKVQEYFDGLIEGIIDGGECGIGTESTLLDMSRSPYRVLRQGALPEAEITAQLVASMTIVGITGPTGCGKTTALNVLAEHGALILDCDKVYHELLESDMQLLSELDEAFPGTVHDRVLDRKALGAVVFTDKGALEKLNKISHRHISGEINRRLSEWAMCGGRLAALDAIELISSGISESCDVLIGVLADKETRARRIMARDGIDEEAAYLRINAQRDDEYFKNNCTHVIYNNDTEENFRSSVNKLLTEVL